jgi:Condensation domain
MEPPNLRTALGKHPEASLFPPTSGQALRLRLQRAEQGARGWHILPCVFGLVLQGHAEPDLMSRALTILSCRHTALRSYFPKDPGGEVGAYVRSEAGFWPLEVMDLRGLPEEQVGLARSQALRRLYAPYEHDIFPLLRAVLFLYSDHSVLGISVDHIIFDGESIPVFLKDLDTVTSGLQAGLAEKDLDHLSSDFSEFALWEHSWINTTEAVKVLEYWAPRWAGLGPFPELPACLKSGRTDSKGSGASIKLTIDSKVFTAIAARINAGYVSPFVILSSALIVSLRQLTGAADVGLLFNVSRRNCPGADDGIGLFANRALLSTRATDSNLFHETIPRVREEILDALSYGIMPFGTISSKFRPGVLEEPRTEPYMTVNSDSAIHVPRLLGMECEFDDLHLDEVFGMHPGVNVTLVKRDDGTHEVTCGYDLSLCDGPGIEEWVRAAIEIVEGPPW